MRRPLEDIAATVLFAVVAAVSGVALFKTAASPFREGSFGPAQWALFIVTVAGATCAFVRSLRYVSEVARRRSEPHEQTPEPEQPAATPRTRMHPVLDDLTWAALALAVLAINALVVWAAVNTLGDLFGDSTAPVGWLIWQLALLAAAAVGLGRLSGAVAAELRDRSRRRRRNAVHVVTGKLMNWPARSSSTGRRSRQRAAVAATAVLASVSLASASGPLLEPESQRPARTLTSAPVGDTQSPEATPDPAKAQLARAAAAQVEAELKRKRARARLRREAATEVAVVVPELPPAPPPPTAPSIVPQPAPGADESPTAQERRVRKHRANERRRRSDERRQGKQKGKQSPQPNDPAPPSAPCDPPAVEPPCGQGQGAPAP